MRWILLWAVLSGCYFTSKETVTRRRVEVRRGREVVARPIDGLVLRVDGAGPRAVVVRATWSRRCHHETTDVVEVRRTYARDLEIEAHGTWGMFFAIFVAPITLPVSWVATIHRDRTSTELAAGAPQIFACPAPGAAVPVALLLPSGATLAGTTDARGAAAFAIPASEPAHGFVVARPAAEVPARSVARRYGEPEAGDIVDGDVEAARAAGRACAHGGAATVALAIDARGLVESIAVDGAGPGLAGCVGARLAGARFGAAHRGRTLDVDLGP